MRQIKRIFIHCSASPEGRPDTAEAIRQWHTMPPPKGRGWRDIGYHYVIELDGRIVTGRHEIQTGAGVAGHNADSIHVCYIGGMDRDNNLPKDTRTSEQRDALIDCLTSLVERYPGAEILGHRDIDAGKACPSFDARKEYSELGKA